MTFANPLTRDFVGRLLKIHSLADLVEQTLVQRAAELDADLSHRAKDFAEEERHEFYESYAEDYYELADELPTILRYSILTAADTALEGFLNDTCQTYAEVHSVAIRLGDIRGNGIRRSRTYLTKIARVDFSNTETHWSELQSLHQLRNCIVHSDGVVMESQAHLRKWSESVPGLSITANGVISLQRAFVDYAIEKYQDFAVAFDKACDSLLLWRSIFPVEEP